MRKHSFVVYLLVLISTMSAAVYAQPTSPNLVAPCDGKSIPVNFLFKWQASSSSNSYTLRIFNPIDQSVIFEHETTQNQQQVSSNTLSMSTPYYWQVKATNADGESDWSDSWGFLTLPAAIDPFQRQEDSDKDGIPDEIENLIKTNVYQKTLFVKPMIKTGANPNVFEYWAGFKSIFENSPDGKAKIEPFEDAGIEIVLIGDTTNPYEPMTHFDYNPVDDQYQPPCTIMAVVLERIFDADNKPVTHYSDGYNGHTYLLHGLRNSHPVNVWAWARPAWTDSNPLPNEYNFPLLYPYPIDRYFNEGAYEKINQGQVPAVTDCSESPEVCSNASPMNFPDSEMTPPLNRSEDSTVEFNAITIRYNGEIRNIDINNRGKPYTKTDVKAKLITHEMAHGVLSAVIEEHCENPCCIMYNRMIDWEKSHFGPECSEEVEPCRQVCEHSPGGSKDIRSYNVVHNVLLHTTIENVPIPITPGGIRVVN